MEFWSAPLRLGVWKAPFRAREHVCPAYQDQKRTCRIPGMAEHGYVVLLLSIQLLIELSLKSASAFFPACS